MMHLQGIVMQTQQRSNFAFAQKNFNNALRHATKWYAAENEKKSQGKRGLLAGEVCKHINKTYNTNLHCKKIGNLVTKGWE